MDSVIQIFQNLAKNDVALNDICRELVGNDACAGVDCDKCAFKDEESMKRAANVLTNKLGG